MKQKRNRRFLLRNLYKKVDHKIGILEMLEKKFKKKMWLTIKTNDKKYSENAKPKNIKNEIKKEKMKKRNDKKLRIKEKIKEREKRKKKANKK